MRGYFGIGVEGASKAMNVGSLFRTAHAFGAGFVFTVNADHERRDMAKADTADSTLQVPFYRFADAKSMLLPSRCELVGIEVLDEAVELPSFRHPVRAAYVLGRERGSLSEEMQARCRHIVRIPTSFAINLAVAGAIVLYDRLLSYGRFAPRPVRSGGPTEEAPVHTHGEQIFRDPERIERFMKKKKSQGE
jgi:tRNA G18 (ribose-2'-O)-methylase SpoU